MKILVTGARGVIGTALAVQLPDLPMTRVDLPEYDVRDYETTCDLVKGHDVVVHLAWLRNTDGYTHPYVDPDNTRMFCNVYKAALEHGVRRVIMASSVHARTIPPDGSEVPSKPYGAHKVFMEELGRIYSGRGLEVVCIRFGAVTGNDALPVGEEMLRLTHRDLGNLCRACITQPMHRRFEAIWGISRVGAAQHDLSNAFGWQPLDN
jgi:nucleoside-diphosphate-sugar epimerase